MGDGETMSEINGIPDHVLEDIELRLLGADHRPWMLSGPQGMDHAGRRMVLKGSKKAMKKATFKAHEAAIALGATPAEDLDINESAGLRLDSATATKELALFFAGESTTEEMLSFVAHAPHDVELLVSEVKTLKSILSLCKESKNKAVKELQAAKVAASRAEAKIVDMRRAWRELCKEMGTKP